jgi:hypothetical protein
MSDVQGNLSENQDTENNGCSNSAQGWGCFNLVAGAFTGIIMLAGGIKEEKIGVWVGLLAGVGIFILMPLFGTIGALIGDFLRKVAHPDMMFTTGGMGAILKFKIFWAIGPQIIGTLIGWMIAFGIISGILKKCGVPI